MRLPEPARRRARAMIAAARGRGAPPPRARRSQRRRRRRPGDVSEDGAAVDLGDQRAQAKPVAGERRVRRNGVWQSPPTAARNARSARPRRRWSDRRAAAPPRNARIVGAGSIASAPCPIAGKQLVDLERDGAGRATPRRRRPAREITASISPSASLRKRYRRCRGARRSRRPALRQQLRAATKLEVPMRAPSQTGESARRR